MSNDRRTVEGRDYFRKIYGDHLPTALGKFDATDAAQVERMLARLRLYLAERVHADGQKIFRLFVQVVDDKPAGTDHD